MTGAQPYFPWAISLDALKFRVFKSDQPGLLLTGTSVISNSDPWRAGIDVRSKTTKVG